MAEHKFDRVPLQINRSSRKLSSDFPSTHNASTLLLNSVAELQPQRRGDHELLGALPLGGAAEFARKRRERKNETLRTLLIKV